MKLNGRIVVYSTTGCPHCKAAKGKLERLNLPYEEINLTVHPDQRDVMIKATNKRTVPQIFFNDRHVGGNEELQNLSEDEMAELITLVRENEAGENAPLVPADSPGSVVEKHEEDELASLVRDMSKQSGIIRTHRRAVVSTFPKTFTGDDAITYIAHAKEIARSKALQVASALVQRKFVSSVYPKDGMPFADDSTLYQFIHDKPSEALNASIPAYEKINSPSELALSIRNSILELYGKYLSDNGKAVDYTRLGASPEFQKYKQKAALLQRAAVEHLRHEEKLAFFINVYNALVIHGRIVFGYPVGAYKIYRFFNDVKYIIGGHEYSCDDIENGVLRANRKGVGQVFKPFGKHDPRINVSLAQNEPLIHFALVCGAKSCPPISTYSADRVMEQLRLAGESFLESEDGCSLDVEERIIGLSLILKWYKEDFGTKDLNVLNFVRNHMAKGDKKTALSNLIESGKYKLLYLPYDWTNNSS